MKFPKHFDAFIQSILWSCIGIYVFLWCWRVFSNEQRIIFIIVFVIALIIWAITQIKNVKKYHEISKKALVYETITRSEFEFWKKYSGDCWENYYEEYLQTSVNLSEEGKDKVLKDKLIEILKHYWEKKSFFDKLFYFFKYENCDFHERTKLVKEFMIWKYFTEKNEYCPFCKKFTDNEKQKNDVFCSICGRQRGMNNP